VTSGRGYQLQQALGSAGPGAALGRGARARIGQRTRRVGAEPFWYECRFSGDAVVFPTHTSRA
jgi:hypothetical protein